MRRILHLSDLHFGRCDPRIASALASEAHALSPHLVVVSGDLTQRARHAQFREAREFLASLPSPRLVVPGNHDVLLWNVFSRFFRKFRRYLRYIEEELAPTFEDAELCVLGVATPRSSRVSSGRVRRHQLEELLARLKRAGPKRTKIVVSHHPLEIFPERARLRTFAWRRRIFRPELAEGFPDLLLAGHDHRVSTEVASHPIEMEGERRGHSTIYVQAGTATSTRHRGEPNAFNCIDIDRDRIEITSHEWDGRRFTPATRRSYQR